MVSAAFTVNGVSHSTSAHSVAYSSTVNLALVSTLGVNTITWRVFGTSQPGMASPTITPAGSPSGATASFPFMATPGDDVGRAVGIECKVIGNGGDEFLAYAIIGVVGAAGNVPFVAGELDYRSTTHGVGGDMNAAIAAAATAGGGSSTEAIKSAVRLTTVAALPAHNFVANVMTATSNGALSVDGTAVAAGDRILVKDEAASHLQHGIYDVTATGSAGTPWVLTRSTDWNASDEFEIGSQVLVMAGATQALQVYALTTPSSGAIVLNTTALGFSRSGGAITGQSDVTLTSALKLRDARSVNVMNAGATGDGSTADDTAFSAAVTSSGSESVPLEIVRSHAINNANQVFSRRLKFRQGGKLKPRWGRVIQINEPIFADPYQQIFDTSSNSGEMINHTSEFDNAGWTKSEVTVSANVDGATDSILETVANAAHYVEHAIDLQTPTAAVMKFSVEAKRRNRDYIYLEHNGSRTFFNLATGLIGTRFGLHAAKIEALRDPATWVATGYYRCTIEVAWVTGGVRIGVSSDGSTISYAGNTSNGVDLRNAHVEQPSEVRIRASSGGDFRNVRIYANWWLGPGMDIAQAWNQMIRSTRRLASDFSDKQSPIVYSIAPGAYEFTNTIDMTCLRANQKIDLTGAQLFAKVGRDKAAIDLLGSSSLDIIGLDLTSPHNAADGVCTGVGILEGRPGETMSVMTSGGVNTSSAGSSSGKHTFRDCRLKGFYPVAAHINLAAEVSKWIGGQIDNSAGQSNCLGKTLSAQLLAGGTTMNLTAGHGTAFPDPTDEHGPYFLLLSKTYDAVTSTRIFEIVKVTAKPGADQFTIARAQFSGLSGSVGMSSTGLQWETADTVVDWLPISTIYACRQVVSDLQPIIGGHGTLSPFSCPGVAGGVTGSGSTATGYQYIGTELYGQCMVATLWIDGFNRIEWQGNFRTGGPGAHKLLDARARSIIGDTDYGYYSHGGTLYNSRRSCVYAGAGGQVSNIQDCHATHTKAVSTGEWAFYLDNVVAEGCTWGWTDDYGGFYASPTSGLQDCTIHQNSKVALPIVLPSSDDTSPLLQGRATGCRIFCRSDSQVSKAFNMAGTRIFADGAVNSGGGTLAASVLATPEEVWYGPGNIAKRRRDGFEVKGRAGQDLPDVNYTMVHAVASWGQYRQRTLTANRQVLLSNSGLANVAADIGKTITIARADLTAFTVEVQNHDTTVLYTFPASRPGEVTFRWNGTDWAVDAIWDPELNPNTVHSILYRANWSLYWDADIVQQVDDTTLPILYNLVGTTNLVAGTVGNYRSTKFGTGRASVRLNDSSSQHYRADALTTIASGADTAVTAIIQYQLVNTTGTKALWGFGRAAGGNERFRLFGSSSGWIVDRRGATGGAITSSAVGAWDLNEHILAVRFTGTTVSLYQDSASNGDLTDLLSAFAMDTADLTTLDEFAIGAGFVSPSGTPTNHANTWIRRLAFASGANALSEAQIKDVINDWKAR